MSIVRDDVPSFTKFAWTRVRTTPQAGGVYCLIFDADSTEKYKQHEGDWLRDCEEDSVIRRDADGNKIYLQREIMGLSVDDAAVVERVSGNKFVYKKCSLKQTEIVPFLVYPGPPQQNQTNQHTQPWRRKSRRTAFGLRTSI